MSEQTYSECSAPGCHSLRADLAAAIQRAEGAERERDAALAEAEAEEREYYVLRERMSRKDAGYDRLAGDLAAAREGRDRLRDLLAEIAERMENDDITYAQGNLLAKRIRAALEKANG